MEEVNVIKKLGNIFPMQSFLTIYKQFAQPHLNCGDIVQEQPNKNNFFQKNEDLESNSAFPNDWSN